MIAPTKNKDSDCEDKSLVKEKEELKTGSFRKWLRNFFFAFLWTFTDGRFWFLPFRRYNHKAAKWMWLMGFLYWLGKLAGAFFMACVISLFVLMFVGPWVIKYVAREMSSFFEGREMVSFLAIGGFLCVCSMLWQFLYWKSYCVVSRAFGRQPESFFKLFFDRPWGDEEDIFTPKVMDLLDCCDRYAVHVRKEKKVLKTPLWFRKWFWTLPLRRYNHEAASWMWLMAFSYWLQNMIGILSLAFFFVLVGGVILGVAWTKDVGKMISDFLEMNHAMFFLPLILLFVWQIFYWIAYYVVIKSVGQKPGNFFTWGLRSQFGRKVRALLEHCDQYVGRMDQFIG